MGEQKEEVFLTQKETGTWNIFAEMEGICGQDKEYILEIFFPKKRGKRNWT